MSDNISINKSDLVKDAVKAAVIAMQAAMTAAIEQAIEKHAEEPEEIDADRCGEIIKENGWCLYDLSLDPDDVGVDIADMIGEMSSRELREALDFDAVAGAFMALEPMETLKKALEAAKARLSKGNIMDVLADSEVLPEGAIYSYTGTADAARFLACHFEIDELVAALMEESTEADKVAVRRKLGVTDAVTPTVDIIDGLVWHPQRGDPLTFDEALRLCTPGGWRLPTISEVLSVLRASGEGGELYEDRWGFIGEVWCSDPTPTHESQAWVVSTATADIRMVSMDTDIKRQVRLVRAVK